MVQEREWTWQEAQGVSAGGCAGRVVDITVITASAISFDIVKFKIIKTLLYSAPLMARVGFGVQQLQLAAARRLRCSNLWGASD